MLGGSNVTCRAARAEEEGASLTNNVKLENNFYALTDSAWEVGKVGSIQECLPLALAVYLIMKQTHRAQWIFAGIRLQNYPIGNLFEPIFLV